MVAETELLKTQTTAAEIEHQKVIAEILQDIVRIKLTGERDRQRLTNEYLSSVAASLGNFDEEAKVIEAEIQQYVAFNEQLLQRISDYQDEIVTRIQSTDESIERQKARIAEMEQQARDIALEIATSTSTATTTDEN